MSKDQVREDARRHWAYTQGAIEAAAKVMWLNDSEMRKLDLALVLAEYAYIEAYIHGFKHGHSIESFIDDIKRGDDRP